MISAWLARARGVRVVWLCHNVNRETEAYWPGITARRRRIWKGAAELILVPDPALMDMAHVVFLGERDKLVPIIFGPLPVPTLEEDERRRVEAIRRFCDAPAGDESGRRPLRLLLASNRGTEYLHLHLLPRLCEALEQAGWLPRIVVVGPSRRSGPDHQRRGLPRVPRLVPAGRTSLPGAPLSAVGRAGSRGQH